MAASDTCGAFPWRYGIGRFEGFERHRPSERIFSSTFTAFEKIQPRDSDPCYENEVCAFKNGGIAAWRRGRMIRRPVEEWASDVIALHSQPTKPGSEMYMTGTYH